MYCLQLSSYLFKYSSCLLLEKIVYLVLVSCLGGRMLVKKVPEHAKKTND